MKIRCGGRENDEVLDRIAHDRRATQIDVEGKANRPARYNADWLRDRRQPHVRGAGWPIAARLASGPDEPIPRYTPLREDRPGESVVPTNHVRPETWHRDSGLRSPWSLATKSPLMELCDGNGYEAFVH